MSTDLKKVQTLINTISPSFCAAKWYNASIWLNNGRTASCHHPLAHFIPTAELFKNPDALHNTGIKKDIRKEMLNGDRPAECGYCWKVEDLNDKSIYSDRIYKSMIYSDADILSIPQLDPDKGVDPKTLEICFDNFCNLGCSYCNSEFSSTWSADISTNGPYLKMRTNGGQTYKNDGQHCMPFCAKNEGNFYIKKFFEWFSTSLRFNLQELRISGGEPTRSPDFWKLVDSFDHETFNFAVNTNLMVDEIRLAKLANIKQHFNKFDIYTSGESIGKNAEFVRSGLNYDVWKSNLYNLQIQSPEITTHIMMTISALSIWTVPEFLMDILELREQTRSVIRKDSYYMSVNLLRFPSFQSVTILPSDIRLDISKKICDIVNNTSLLTEWEQNSFLRCAKYLTDVDASYEDTDSLTDKLSDFKNFITQYSERRKMPIEEYMPIEFNNWFKSL